MANMTKRGRERQQKLDDERLQKMRARDEGRENGDPDWLFDTLFKSANAEPNKTLLITAGGDDDSPELHIIGRSGGVNIVLPLRAFKEQQRQA